MTILTYPKCLLALLLASLILGTTPLSVGDEIPEEWQTVAEKSNYEFTASYDETLEFLNRLEQLSPWIRVFEIGVTPQGRSLKLVVVSKDEAFDPRAIRGTAKAVVLIQNGIHAGEIAGKEATLALLREMVVTRSLESLLDHAALLIVPVFNVDGHERSSAFNRPNQIGPTNAGFRATANRLNLNRDYIKADSPEMRAWIAMFDRWTPDMLIDNHVTDGMDHQYAITYMMPWHPIDAPRIVDWTKNFFEPDVLVRLKRSNQKALPYVDPIDNANLSKGLRGFVSPPRFSTGYAAIRNRVSVLVEMHSLKDFKTRVTSNYDMLVALLGSVNAMYRDLHRVVDLSDNETMQGLTGPYPLTFRNVTDDSIMMEFHGYASSVDTSDMTEGTWVRYRPEAETTLTVPYFHRWEPAVTVVPPRAYLIPREWQTQLALLSLHGVEIGELTDSVTLPVEVIRFDSVKFAGVSYEGHVRPSYSVRQSEENRTFPAGTAVISLRQKLAKVAIHCLEPEGWDALVRWGLWNTIFERKKYIESYSVERLAERMLMEDSALAVDYWSRVESDTAFAADVRARRNFFFERSPYHEDDVNLYPVFRWRGNGELPITRYIDNEMKRRTQALH